MTGFDRAFPIVNYTGQISKVVIFQRQTLRMLLAIKEAIEEAIKKKQSTVADFRDVIRTLKAPFNRTITVTTSMHSRGCLYQWCSTALR